jgi:hypothetical protein
MMAKMEAEWWNDGEGEGGMMVKMEAKWWNDEMMVKVEAKIGVYHIANGGRSPLQSAHSS